MREELIRASEQVASLESQLREARRSGDGRQSQRYEAELQRIREEAEVQQAELESQLVEARRRADGHEAELRTLRQVKEEDNGREELARTLGELEAVASELRRTKAEMASADAERWRALNVIAHDSMAESSVMVPRAGGCCNLTGAGWEKGDWLEGKETGRQQGWSK